MYSTDVTKVKVQTTDFNARKLPAKQLLDLAFTIDCTGSMRPYIESATKNIRTIVANIVRIENVDVRLALVEYRDHSSQEDTFLTIKHDFTDSVEHMYQRLSKCKAQGGGDEPEAVEDGLKASLELNWRLNATKVCILIADSPPHGIGAQGDALPLGCPRGVDPLSVANEMAKKGITLYTVGCEPSLRPYKEFFSALAYKTGGVYVPLVDVSLLAVAIESGAREALSLDSVMNEIVVEIEQMRHKYPNNEQEFVQAVHVLLVQRNVQTNQIKMDKSSLPSASPIAKRIARLTNLADFRREFGNFGRQRDDVHHSSDLTTVDRSRPDSSSHHLTTIDRSVITVDQTERIINKIFIRK